MTIKQTKVNSRLEEVSSQLAEIEQQKANKVDVANISSGTPNFASSVFGMTDTTKNYVNTTDGYLYTYNDTTFIKTEVKYQSTGLQENSVTDKEIGTTLNSTVATNVISNHILKANKINISSMLNLSVTDINGTITANKTNDKTFGFFAFAMKQNCIFTIAENTIWYMFNEDNLICKMIGLKGVDQGKVLEINMNTQEVKYIKSIEFKQNVNLGETIIIDFTINTTLYKIVDNIKVMLCVIDEDCNRCGFVVGGQVGVIAKKMYDGRIENLLSLTSNNNQWDNKLWLTFGDSITYLNKYQPYISNNLNMRYIDHAWNGGRTIELLKMLRESTTTTCDLISVLIGTNDFMMHMPLGIESDVTEGTFYGNLDVICREIIVKFPQATIFFMTPLQRWGYVFEDKETTMTNDEGVDLYEYANAIVKVANRYGFPVLDLYRNSQFNKYNINIYTYDGLHPSDYGYQKLSQQIQKFIENLG